MAKNLPNPRLMLDEIGDQAWFYVNAWIHIRTAIVRYPREVRRLLVETTFGTGALAVIGGTTVTTSFMTAIAGIELGIQGFDQLSNLGVEALSGFVSAYLNTRLGAPIVASITLVATIGAGFTSELGAMRVAEEIDAVEVMAIQTVPFMVSSRIVAGMLAITPVYLLSLVASYVSTRFIVTAVYGQSAGAYDHYFRSFLNPTDIVMSFVTIAVTSFVIMSIHCYYGYFASGGAVGVGLAVGRAVRLALVAALATNLLVSMALYGSTNSLNISGS